MTYHYIESGLDDLYLENGYAEHVTPYGPGVSIEDSNGLHKAIGQWLIERPAPLNGAELRFLRTEMELTQRDLAGILGATEQTLRLWEKSRGKHIPGPPDRLVRTLFAEHVGANHNIRRMLERLADLDRLEHDRANFRRTKETWRPLVAPTLEPCAEVAQA